MIRAHAVLGLLALAAAVALSGCSRVRAKTAPEAPPLEMPSPPPRDVEQNETEAPPPVPLVEEPARRAPARPRQTPPPVQTPKPEQPSQLPPEPPPVELPKPVEEPPKPPATLETTPAAEAGQVETAIRNELVRATADLNRIDYRALNAEARMQYDTAKRFISQSQDALRTKNLVFARSLADKAAALAAQLAGK